MRAEGIREVSTHSRGIETANKTLGEMLGKQRHNSDKIDVSEDKVEAPKLDDKRDSSFSDFISAANKGGLQLRTNSATLSTRPELKNTAVKALTDGAALASRPMAIMNSAIQTAKAEKPDDLASSVGDGVSHLAVFTKGALASAGYPGVQSATAKPSATPKMAEGAGAALRHAYSGSQFYPGAVSASATAKPSSATKTADRVEASLRRVFSGSQFHPGALSASATAKPSATPKMAEGAGAALRHAYSGSQFYPGAVSASATAKPSSATKTADRVEASLRRVFSGSQFHPGALSASATAKPSATPNIADGNIPKAQGPAIAAPDNPGARAVLTSKLSSAMDSMGPARLPNNLGLLAAAGNAVGGSAGASSAVNSDASIGRKVFDAATNTYFAVDGALDLASKTLPGQIGRFSGTLSNGVLKFMAPVGAIVSAVSLSDDVKTLATGNQSARDQAATITSTVSNVLGIGSGAAITAAATGGAVAALANPIGLGLAVAAVVAGGVSAAIRYAGAGAKPPPPRDASLIEHYRYNVMGGRV